jgi:transcriptional regulator with XRE-family HTH domain
MSKDAASDFKMGFIARTKAARIAAGRTQEEMAKLLGVTQGHYKQYETRSPLPHRYVEVFCLATGVTLEWLFKGKGRAPRI